jgi:hypothetical protein
MTFNNTVAFARGTVQDRRRGRLLGETAAAACTLYLERAEAVDEALELHRTSWLQHLPTLEEMEQRVDRAYEQLFLAGVEVDAILPASESSAVSWVQLMATMHSATRGG